MHFKPLEIAVVVLASATLSSFATAQTLQQPPGGRIVAIGDSLSDNGNTFAYFGFPAAPYFDGRFSNGRTWVELLSGGAMNKPLVDETSISGNVNLAFGGARTDDAHNLFGPIPGMTTQIASYLSLGGTFGAKDTITMWGGANNIFLYFRGAGAGANIAGSQTTGAAAAHDIVSMVTQVAQAGAGRILVANLPDIGATPLFNGSSAVAMSGSAGSTSYNQTLASALPSVAAANTNTNIVQMDISAMLALASRNPTAFGFANVTQACTTSATCVSGGAAVQDTYLFWDEVHPTAAGHRLIAQYALLLLNPEIPAAAVSPIGEAAVSSRRNAMSDIFDRTQGWARGQYDRQNGIWASATGMLANNHAHGDTPAYRSATGGVRGGLDNAMGNILAGVSLGYSDGSISGTLRSDIRTLDVDAYATWTSGAFYATGTIGAAALSFDDIRRFTGFPSVDARGSTSSVQASAAAETGYLMKMGGVTLTPAVRLQYMHSALKGYEETAPILAMKFENRSIDAVVAGLRIRASRETPFGNLPGSVFGEIGYDRYLSENQDPVLARFISNTAQPFAGTPGHLVGTGLNFKVGYDTNVTPNAHLTLSYGGAFQDGAGYAQKAEARLKVPF